MSVAKTRGSHSRKAIRGVCTNERQCRSKTVEGKLVNTDLAVLNRWNSVWHDTGRYPIKNINGYTLKMHVFIVANQTLGTLHETVL